jgi:hypothetical protein
VKFKIFNKAIKISEKKSYPYKIKLQDIIKEEDEKEKKADVLELEFQDYEIEIIEIPKSSDQGQENTKILAIRGRKQAK